MNGYISPFTKRYGSNQMHLVWADTTERNLWRATWLQMVMQLDIDPLDRAKAVELLNIYIHLCGIGKADLAMAEMAETTTKHDLAAELEVFKRTLPVELSKRIHAGATSSDIQDIATLTRLRWSTGLLLIQLKRLCSQLGKMVANHAYTRCMGRTHLQPAEPTTFGYRMAVYLQELSSDVEMLLTLCNLPGFHSGYARGVRGAVGTGANMLMISLDREEALDLMLIGQERTPMIVGQTYPRTIEYRLAAILSTSAATLHKLGMDMRYLQSLDLIRENKTPGQVGSSAMPGKSNPIIMEKVCALSRKAVNLSREIWDASALSMLERTLDDSAGRRSALPELMLSIEEALQSATASLESTYVCIATMDAECQIHWRQWLASRVLAIHRANGLDDYAKVEEAAQTAATPYAFIDAYLPGYSLNDLYRLEAASYFATYLAEVSEERRGIMEPVIKDLLRDFPCQLPTYTPD